MPEVTFYSLINLIEVHEDEIIWMTYPFFGSTLVLHASGAGRDAAHNCQFVDLLWSCLEAGCQLYQNHKLDRPSASRTDK